MISYGKLCNLGVLLEVYMYNQQLDLHVDKLQQERINFSRILIEVALIAAMPNNQARYA